MKNYQPVNTKIIGEIKAETLNGEVYTMLQDNHGGFGFTSNKGYNSWEGTTYYDLGRAIVAMYRVIENVNKEI